MGIRGWGRATKWRGRVSVGAEFIFVKLLKTKSTRFAFVVETAGKPEVFTLWQDPKHDRPFQSMIRNHRVMTLLKSPTGTEFGQTAFKNTKGATYLIFPKSLKPFENHRIVGIKWDQVQE